MPNCHQSGGSLNAKEEAMLAALVRASSAHGL